MFESVELTTDLLDTSTATFTIGDQGAWGTLERIVQPGSAISVYANGYLQMTGRSETIELPIEAGSGAVLQLVCRTKMADARYTSADPRISLQNCSIKEFMLRLYEPLGYGPSDFAFSAATERNLLTGKRVGAEDPTDLEPIKSEQAKVNPPETVFECASRQLKRHHLMHWDAADGRILVGAPDDEQAPRYFFQSKRGAASVGNNILSARRVVDWSEIASDISVFGGSGAKDVTKAAIRGVAADVDVLVVAASTGHFRRAVIIPNEGAKTQAQANAQARRELAARANRKNAWEIQTDGWSFWNGHDIVNMAINTTCDIDVDVTGYSASGRFLISRLTRRLDVENGATSTLTLLAPGIFVL
jgi:prophage tail gpP-like protein